MSELPDSEALLQLIVQQPATRFVRLKPLPVDDQLRDGPFADVANHLVGSSRIRVDVDLGVGDSVRIEELLGCSAVAAPRSRVDPDVHT